MILPCSQVEVYSEYLICRSSITIRCAGSGYFNFNDIVPHFIETDSSIVFTNEARQRIQALLSY